MTLTPFLLNTYAYAGNDPRNGSDPSGMDQLSDFINYAAAAMGDASIGNAVDVDPVVVTGVPLTSLAAAVGTAGYIGGAGSGVRLNELVVIARKKGMVGNTRINFGLPWPVEQLWLVDAAGAIVNIPTKSTIGTCNGKEFGKNVPADSNFSLSGAQAVIHDHPDWALPFPGPEDAVIPSVFGIPNYGISPAGAWVVSPGPPIGVQLLSGSYGEGPNGETFNATDFTSMANAPGSGGKAPGC